MCNIKCNMLCYVKYKIMIIFLQNPLQEIQKISCFLGCNQSKQFCEEVVKLTSLEHMKVVEKQRSGQSSQMYWKDGKAGFIGKGRNIFS